MNKLKMVPAYRPKLADSVAALIPAMQEAVALIEAGQEQSVYAFAWYEEKQTKMVEAKRSLSTSIDGDRGIVLRAMCDGVQFERATNNISAEAILNCAQQLRKKIAETLSQVTQPAYQPSTWQQEQVLGLSVDITQQLPAELTTNTVVHFAPLCQQNFEDITLDAMVEMATALRKQVIDLSARAVEEETDYQPLADALVMMRFKTTTHVFVDRNKTLSQLLPISILNAMGMTAAGQMARITEGGMGTLELIEIDEDKIHELAITPLELSQAPKLAAGRYQVITGPGISGVIAHEAFGHTQEGDTWMKGRSIASRLREEGVRVGNDQATIMNNPAMYQMDGMAAGSNGSYYFDNEGQLARPQAILEKGYLSTPMTDLTSAQKLNVARTANGKRESWRRPLMSRQTNTYFTPGDKSLGQLIAMVENGFLAVKPYGGMEDPKGGSLTVGAAYFEEIKQGVLTGKKFLGPAGGHIEITDSVFDILDRIVAKTKVEEEHQVPSTQLGGCGKYHKELVDAGVGGPYILWESVACG
ncbi:TldD/PmbA family protein [Reinekea sp.]|jgi:TldD protein|uniref:TldD/PmbA family protein n=1 Tax=Reinekea sp. TaxID=1970455 RepID=UPI003988CEC1